MHENTVYDSIPFQRQVVVDPYPGQEERNASMLLEEGAGRGGAASGASCTSLLAC